jgi:hypothetical protein
MKLIFKIIYYGSIAFVAICVIVIAFLKLFQAEFTHQYQEDIFYETCFWGVPLAVLLTSSRVGFIPTFSKSRKKNIVTNTLFVSFGLLFIFILFALASLDDMCNWSTGEIIFEHRTNHSVKIVRRYFGCGATDSSPATPGIYKETQITPLFVHFTKVDTTALNAADWVRVQQQ